MLKRVSNKEIVILSRQLAILFEAQVSALRIFRLIAAEVENPFCEKFDPSFRRYSRRKFNFSGFAETSKSLLGFLCQHGQIR
jgi:type II secretory pathway component PulF